MKIKDLTEYIRDGKNILLLLGVDTSNHFYEKCKNIQHLLLDSVKMNFAILSDEFSTCKTDQEIEDGITDLISNDETIDGFMFNFFADGDIGEKINVLKVASLMGLPTVICSNQKGTFSFLNFMDRVCTNNEISDYFDSSFRVKIEQNYELIIDYDAICKCPKCGSNIVETDKVFKCMRNDSGNCKFIIWKKICEKEITKDIAMQLIKNGKTDILKGFISKKTGKPFNGKLILKDDSSIGFDFSK